MVKSVSFLVAVLTMAVSLHSTHAVSAALFNPKAIAQHLPKVDGWTKENLKSMKKLKEIVDAAKDGVEKGIKFHDKDAQGRSIQYSRVTGIIVGDHKLEDGQHGVILIVTAFPFPFLNEKAFGLLKDEFSTAKELHRQFGPLCTTDLYPPVTLVYADDGAEKKQECPWHKQSDGSMCLGILTFQK
ncbi:hypothetical protein CFC21_027008 [Triticum aestivum]|uniref:Uncharacterized protein n=3 Tax=Triticinae TaxID=1648030 RepID=A0A9R1ELS3_WHEAT|nr:hypothetical protein CFC21_027008 [Triticum aestivum]